MEQLEFKFKEGGAGVEISVRKYFTRRGTFHGGDPCLLKKSWVSLGSLTRQVILRGMIVGGK